jgi:hypothetical protein
MNKRKPILLVAWNIMLLLIAAVSILVAYITTLGNRDLKRTLSSYLGKQVITPEFAKTISADLESSNTSRIEMWKLYFRKAADNGDNNQSKALTFLDVVNIYQSNYISKEKPLRSTLFCELLMELDLMRQAQGLTITQLTSIAGPPDEVTNAAIGRTFLYRLNMSGTNAVVMFQTSNNDVSSFDIR